MFAAVKAPTPLAQAQAGPPRPAAARTPSSSSSSVHGSSRPAAGPPRPSPSSKLPQQQQQQQPPPAPTPSLRNRGSASSLLLSAAAAGSTSSSCASLAASALLFGRSDSRLSGSSSIFARRASSSNLSSTGDDDDDDDDYSYYLDESDIDDTCYYCAEGGESSNGGGEEEAINTMGNSASSKNRRPSREQEDLKHLGDRYPFGDAELVHLYRAYHQKRQQEGGGGGTLPPPSSFFADWGERTLRQQEVLKERRRVRQQQAQAQQRAKQQPQQQQGASGGGSDEEEFRSQLEGTLAERRALIEVAERQILPAGFGNRLYEVAFLAQGDASPYGRGNGGVDGESEPKTSGAMDRGTSPSPSSPPPEDDYMRMARLEAFHEGLSNSSRRGSRATMTVLFRTCEPRGGGRSAGGGGGDSIGEVWVSSKEFVDVGYRVAMASAFLRTAKRAQRYVESRGGGQQANDNNDVDDDESDDEADVVAPQDYLLHEDDCEDSNDEGGAGAGCGDEASADIKAASGSCKYSDVEKKLTGLARSIVERGKARRQRTPSYSTSTVPPDGAVDEDEMLGRGYVQLDDVLDWADAIAPLFASILPTLMFEIFFPGRPYPPSRTPFDVPRLQETSAFFSSPSSPLLFSLACMSSHLNGNFYRLYTSESDGLSFNRLLNALLGYSGPTLLLVRDASSNVFGAYTSSAWKESKDFYGDSDCFLFAAARGSLAVYRPTGKASNFQYCNSYARSRGYDQQAHGIGFGGSTQQPRLFLSEGLDETCRATTQDLTFDNGSLLLGNSKAQQQSSATFTVESLEVWAVGGDDVVRQGLGARDKVRQMKEEGIRRARKVDKAQFLDDLRSGAIHSKAFQYREQIDGRADEDVRERHRAQGTL